MKNLTNKDIELIRESRLFSSDYYNNRYEDVMLSGIDPFDHFIRIGSHIGREPNKLFSNNYYLSQLQLDQNTNLSIPLLHYLNHGWRENNNPHPHFDVSFYLNNNSDVKDAGLEPLTHYLNNGQHEGRLIHKETIDPSLITTSISVVIPTHNRADALPSTIHALFASASDLDIEVIIVNDGSTDHTAEVMRSLKKLYPNISTITIENQGAGVARNHGASLACKDVILFIGDDIIPASRDFLAAHVKYHQFNSSLDFAVLGKVDWPADACFNITPVMRHIQGPGGEQFGYADMQPYRPWDWRFFYTCNVSVKRKIVADWLIQGFSPAFKGCGFEDGEFAYRMGKTHGTFHILYIDESVGHHYHRHTVDSFLRRQRLCGAMAQVLIDAHPELIWASGFGEVHETLHSGSTEDLQSIQLNMSMAESLFSWVKLLEHDGKLGDEKWHKQLLHSVFRIASLLGFLEYASTPLSSYSSALKYVLNSSCQELINILPKNNWSIFGFTEKK